MTDGQRVQNIIAQNYADLFMTQQLGRDFDLHTAIKNAFLAGMVNTHSQLKNAIIAMEREAKAMPAKDPFENISGGDES